MRIVLEIDPVQMVGFNEAQRDFILRVMTQSIRVSSVKALRRRTLRSWLIWLARTSKLRSVVARPGVRRT